MLELEERLKDSQKAYDIVSPPGFLKTVLNVFTGSSTSDTEIKTKKDPSDIV